MPADSKIPSLIEVGPDVFNVCYLIMRRRVGKPDPGSEIDVYLEEGMKVRLKGDNARLFDRRLAQFIVPEDAPAEATETTKIVRGRRGPRAPEKAE